MLVHTVLMTIQRKMILFYEHSLIPRSDKLEPFVSKLGDTMKALALCKECRVGTYKDSDTTYVIHLVHW